MEIIQKYLKKRSKRVGAKISGSSRNISQVKNGVCEISQTLKKGCEITSQQKADFVVLRSCLSACGVQLPTCRKYRETSGGIPQHCAKWLRNSRNKRLISQPCKNLPLAWSDLLAMVVTPSFQLRIVHRLKHWILDFLRFEMVYSM